MPTAKPRYLIIGASGLIGSGLRQLLSTENALLTYHRTPFPGGVPFDPLRQRLRDLGPDVFRCTHAILLYANSKPDACFADPDGTHAINVSSLEPLVRDLHSAGLHITFFSTEFVFDGTRGKYSEADPPRPILIYGQQKLAAENLVCSLASDALVFRLAKAFGTEANDNTLFTQWLRPLLNRSPVIRAAIDQAFSPVAVPDACRTILNATARNLSGLYHLSGNRRYTRHALLELFLSAASPHLPADYHPIAEPCSLRDITLPEPRPLDVSLCADRLAATGALHIEPIEAWCQRIATHHFASVPASTA